MMPKTRETIKKIGCEFEPITSISSTSEFDDWLKKQKKYLYGLIHADNGVIWGQFANDKWTWSGEVFPAISPLTQFERLQQIRLFGDDSEAFLWRENNELRGRIIRDVKDSPAECFDEDQLLWGQPYGAPSGGFTLMREGSQGLLHAPPESIANAGKITTRNYIDYDSEGCAYVKASRLVAK